MALTGQYVVLDAGLGGSGANRRKRRLAEQISTAGGIVELLVTKRTTLVVVLPPNEQLVELTLADYPKAAKAHTREIPVVHEGFIASSVSGMRLADVEAFRPVWHEELEATMWAAANANNPPPTDDSLNIAPPCEPATEEAPGDEEVQTHTDPDGAYVFKWGPDPFALQANHPDFPERNYSVARHRLLRLGSQFAIVELHCGNKDGGRAWRVFQQNGVVSGECEMLCWYHSTLSAAEACFSEKAAEWLSMGYEKVLLGTLTVGSPVARAMSVAVISKSQRQKLDAPLQSLVAHLYREAWHSLRRSTRLQLDPDGAHTPLGSLSLKELDQAEGVLARIKQLARDDALQPDDAAQLTVLIKKFNDNLQPEPPLVVTELDGHRLFLMEELCDNLRAVLSVGEASCGNIFNAPVDVQYRALGCQIEPLPSCSPVYQSVSAALAESQYSDQPAAVDSVVNVFGLYRPTERAMLARWTQELAERQYFNSGVYGSDQNEAHLYHGTPVGNLVNILARGLRLPRSVYFRRDPGMLGQALYFALSATTAAKYTTCGQPRDGGAPTAFLLVCHVALGKVKEVATVHSQLVTAPDGFHSVHGVRNKQNFRTEFLDDEFAVYSPEQQALAYLVEVRLKHTVQPLPPPGMPTTKPFVSLNTAGNSAPVDPFAVVTPSAPCKSGLLCNGTTSPLQAVAVKAKLIDLIGEVVLFQQFRNPHTSTVEAKYVFPLQRGCTVCGFEAFIGSKHIVGEVKEKDQARREYREAVAEGHGAYLMEEEEETAEVFTIAIGNLPPHTDVIIKITYILELVYEPNGHTIVFTLPAHLQSAIEDSALARKAQATTATVRAKIEGGFFFEAGITMPYEIKTVWTSRPMTTKRSATRVCVRFSQSGPQKEDLILRISMAEAAAPRLWVEVDPQGHRAAMLVGAPDSFENIPQNVTSPHEVILLLDLSASMNEGGAIEDLKAVATACIQLLPPDFLVNVVGFGSVQDWLFERSEPLQSSSRIAIRRFVEQSKPTLGGSGLWQALHSIFLLDHGKRDSRSVILISDGFVDSRDAVIKLVRGYAYNTRLFALGVGSCDGAFLRALAASGGGSTEILPLRQYSAWHQPLKLQMQRIGQRPLREITVDWSRDPNITVRRRINEAVQQAPRIVQPIFPSERFVVYSFVSHYCMQAELTAYLPPSNNTVETEEDRRRREHSYLVTVVPTITETRGETLHKLCAMNLVRDWQHGAYAPLRETDQLQKETAKTAIVQLGTQYGIVTPWTSMIAVEHRDSGSTAHLEAGVYSLAVLVAKQIVDVLPEELYPEPPKLVDTKPSIERAISSVPMMSHGRWARTADLHLAKEITNDDSIMECLATPHVVEQCEEELEYELMQLETDLDSRKRKGGKKGAKGRQPAAVPTVADHAHSSFVVPQMAPRSPCESPDPLLSQVPLRHTSNSVATRFSGPKSSPPPPAYAASPAIMPRPYPIMERECREDIQRLSDMSGKNIKAEGKSKNRMRRAAILAEPCHRLSYKKQASASPMAVLMGLVVAFGVLYLLYRIGIFSFIVRAVQHCYRALGWLVSCRPLCWVAMPIHWLASKFLGALGFCLGRLGSVWRWATYPVRRFLGPPAVFVGSRLRTPLRATASRFSDAFCFVCKAVNWGVFPIRWLYAHVRLCITAAVRMAVAHWHLPGGSLAAYMAIRGTWLVYQKRAQRLRLLAVTTEPYSSEYYLDDSFWHYPVARHLGTIQRRNQFESFTLRYCISPGLSAIHIPGLLSSRNFVVLRNLPAHTSPDRLLPADIQALSSVLMMVVCDSASGHCVGYGFICLSQKTPAVIDSLRRGSGEVMSVGS
eukprot:TRINITY_DN9733_c0_g1_i1.p1 TRINITY_DN9733_c0_g1~~TRINITY_DN9733_c0_g1_i1.p1  ORF type:complete len:1820 (-),score=224.56 TRINITY_DN9733_c0_g1_i1:3-5462(-)